MADQYHFLELTLENVRAFSDPQMFDFRNADGRAARWCVILGENGVGKTTAMQALAMMRPVPAFERGEDGQVLQLKQVGSGLPDPDWTEPDVFDFENDQLIDLARHALGTVTSKMGVVLEGADQSSITIGFESCVENGSLITARPVAQKHALKGSGPLIIGYGASRHIGNRNLSAIADQRPTDGLFDDLVELADIDEVLERLGHAELAAKAEGSEVELKRVKDFQASIETALKAIIPDLEKVELNFGGARFPGISKSRSGVVFKTKNTKDLPLSNLSLGYRVTVSWIGDLAWRLFEQRPESRAPFQEHAIVVIDEVDLHLHPRWQRQIRHHLLEIFPNVQFIVTTHSPIIAQEAIVNADPVAVVRWDGPRAVVLNDPLPQRPWRYDEIVGSVVFGLGAGVDLRSSELLVERAMLLRKRDLSNEDRARLNTLNGLVHDIESGDVPFDAAFDKLMARVVELEKRLGEAG